MPLADHDADDAASLALHADRLVPQLRAAAGRERGEQLHAAGPGRSGSRAARRRRSTCSAIGRGAGQRVDALRVGVDGGPERVVVAPSCGAPGCRRRWRRRRSSRGSAVRRRSSTIRSRWAGSDTEPSTKSTSYGPGERDEVASGKSTISKCSTTASSSSSRSRSVSWQPSQEANLTTPTRGRRAAGWRQRRTGIRCPPGRRCRRAAPIEKTGPSRQTKYLPIWQWPHSPIPHSMWRSSVT